MQKYLNKIWWNYFCLYFGSYIKGNIRKDSDVDIAIYLKDSVDIYEYLDIKMKLLDALKREVDLVILNDATPLLKYEIYKKTYYYSPRIGLWKVNTR